MGGFIGNIGAKVAGSAAADFGRAVAEEAPAWLRSSDELLGRSKAGAWFSSYWKSRVAPELNRTAAFTMKNFNVDAETAMRSAHWQLSDMLFGPKKEVFSTVIAGAHQERGKVYANQVADIITALTGHEPRVGERWRSELPIVNPATGRNMIIKTGADPIGSYKNAGELEIKVRRLMSYIFPSRMVLPHMSQPLNELLIAPMSAIVKATGEMFLNPKGAADQVALSGALMDEFVHEFKAQANGQDTLLNKLFFQPGFRFVRKLQIKHSALVGKFAAMDASDDLLRNPNNKRAIMQLRLLGVSEKDVLAAGGLTPEMTKTAMFRAADETMFLTRGLRTPPRWDETGLKRLMFAYKHWTFGEGSLVTNSLQRSWALAKAGHPFQLVKTIGVLSTVFPAVGEMVKMVEGLATGNNPLDPEFQGRNMKVVEGLGKVTGVDIPGAQFADEYIDALSHAVGFGIWYSMYRNAQRNALSEFFVGPLIGTAADVGQDIINMRSAQLGRDISARVPVVGSAAGKFLFPRTKKKGRDGVQGAVY